MTMTNAEWMIKNGYKFSNLFVRHLSNEERNKFVVRYNNEKIDYFELNECHISFNDSAYKKWLDMEHKEPILDDAEKRYLAGVIRPFRNKIKHIAKYGGRYHNYYYEYITVMYYVDEVLITYSFGLPVFPEGTMYKGMEVGRKYTLEELGL